MVNMFECHSKVGKQRCWELDRECRKGVPWTPCRVVVVGGGGRRLGPWRAPCPRQRGSAGGKLSWRAVPPPPRVRTPPPPWRRTSRSGSGRVAAGCAGGRPCRRHWAQTRTRPDHWPAPSLEHNDTDSYLLRVNTDTTSLEHVSSSGVVWFHWSRRE